MHRPLFFVFGSLTSEIFGILKHKSPFEVAVSALLILISPTVLKPFPSSPSTASISHNSAMASSIVTSSLKPLAMADSSSSTIFSHPSISSTISSSRIRCSNVSLLTGHINLPLSFSRFSLSLKSKTHLKKSPFVSFVAQTSDWAEEGGEGSVAVEENEDSFESQDAEGDVSEGAEFPEPSEEAKLFVGNLAYDVDSQALAMLFEQAGTVEIAEVNLATSLLCSYGRLEAFICSLCIA